MRISAIIAVGFFVSGIVVLTLIGGTVRAEGGLPTLNDMTCDGWKYYEDDYIGFFMDGKMFDDSENRDLIKKNFSLQAQVVKTAYIAGILDAYGVAYAGMPSYKKDMFNMTKSIDEYMNMLDEYCEPDINKNEEVRMAIVELNIRM